MEKEIKIKTRENSIIILKKLNKPDGSDSKTFVIKSNLPVLKTGYTDDDNKFLDLGGVTLEVNKTFSLINEVVKSITFVDNYGYLISFV